MTSSQRFEQGLSAALSDLATAPYPAYVEDVLVITSRTRRRPAWQFPRRWLPFDVALPARPIVVGAALLLLVLGLLVVAYVGSQRKVPNPFGLARNGVVAFSAEGGGYVAAIDGPPRLVLTGPGGEYGLNFSLDGTRMLFIRVIDDEEYLWVADGDGTRQVQLIAEPLEQPGAISWSPSGDEIALSYPIAGVNRVVIVRVDGTGSRVLDLPFPAEDPMWRPPDGRELLVRRSDRATGELYVVAADGSSMRSLGVKGRGLYGGMYDADGASWSPDGSLVSYHTVDGITDREQFRVHLVRADGTEDRVISSPSGLQEAWPLWSPDGKSIAIQRWTWDGDSRIAILGLDVKAFPPSLGPGHRFEDNMGWTTIWSPDGTRLIEFWDARSGAYSVDPATGDYTKIDWPVTDHLSWQRVAP